MSKIFALTNNLAGRDFSQGNSNEEKEEEEIRKEEQLEKAPEREDGLPAIPEGIPEARPPSEQIDEGFGSCLWITIKELMTRDVVTVQEDTPLEEVFSLLGRLPYHTLPVVNEKNELVGVIDLDIILEILLLCIVPKEKHTTLTAMRSLGGKAGDVMITHPITIPLDATLKDASDLMMKHRLDRVCISDNGKLAGIVSKKDLVKEICKRRKEERAKTRDEIEE
ncbi:CBS domain-containing protein [Methanosarcina sp. T3]|uniref:CBS domain-containing protein n=1 Tax=Methanosarcina sp. T3 TaxID=3439062 RepID=UPI003F86204E